jgi:hypothetical protein
MDHSTPIVPDVELPRGVEPNTKRADDIITRVKRYREHPWAAIEDGIVWTLDSVKLFDPKGVIKPFPKHTYLRECTDIWLTHQLTAWPKSRRMVLSWLMIWNHLWLGMFHPGAHVYMQSINEQNANDELIARAGFIYDHIPESAFPKPRLKQGKVMWCLMEFPKIYSFLKGVPQGANQLRGPTASAVLMDEAAFWEHGRESFGSTKPATEGGGRVTVISSMQRGWYRDLCFDEIE